MSPFVKKWAINEFLKNKSNKVKAEIITNFKLQSIYRGASDIEALQILLDNSCKVTSNHKLHAKIYVFDKKSVIITSSNLTRSGFNYNHEAGVYSEDSNIVKDTLSFYRLIRKSEETGILTSSKLQEANKILSNIPKEKKVSIPTLTLDTIDEDKFLGGIDSINKSLSGWKKDVFSCLLNINKEVFELSDIYSYEHELSSLHPDNENIRAKIRQQLQLLRDIGLLEFTKPGTYKKLWV